MMYDEVSGVVRGGKEEGKRRGSGFVEWIRRAK
jgi:hypothetical protein